jgi:hypothetical protein
MISFHRAKSCLEYVVTLKGLPMQATAHEQDIYVLDRLACADVIDCSYQTGVDGSELFMIM